jgi:hypothetical protein
VVVEVIDLEALQVLGSYRLDEWARFIVGEGMIAYSARDLPFPQVDAIKVPIPEEGS